VKPLGKAARKRVVLTRTREGNEESASMVRALGFEPIAVECLELLPPRDWSPIDSSLRALSTFDWVVFTSGRGAALFKERMDFLGLELKWRGRPSVAAVGEGTATELRESGVPVAFVPSEFLTLKLASELPAGEASIGKQRVLLLRADMGDPKMADILARRGFEVVEHAIYRTEAFSSRGGAITGLEGADAILFASPSAVEGFTSRLGGEDSSIMKRKLAACIGPVTAKSARDHGFERIVTPKAHTFKSLLQEVERELSMVTPNA
jgi:uroporphyrinogen III methyltransferase / synthase